MQPIDWLFVLACITIAVGGYQIGFVAKATSWIGTAFGFIVALALIPVLLRHADSMNPSGRLGVVVLVALSGLLLGQMLGLLVGNRLARFVPPGSFRIADKIVGALSGVISVLLLLWLLLPTLANMPGWPAQQVRSSHIARGLYDTMPRSPDWAKELNRLVGSSGFPSVFNDIAPSPNTGPAPETVALPPAVIESVRASTVKVEGVACRRTQDGSGFVVDEGLVVTNAHVVAGERRTNVITVGGATLPATVVAFDAGRDLALLRVPRLSARPLPLAEAHVGDIGAVFGHPGGQAAIEISPAAVRREISAIGRDLYDQRSTRRQVLVLAAQLAQGDSGGALINYKGEVIGVAFAIAPDKPDTAYALHTSELRAVLAQPHLDAVETGGCVFE